ncbi:tetrapyrrole biosynthesis, uroporphyrinogen III synthase [Ascobolus immersus RN42]|uniref:Tetrapyrrole biosynthesis, uroporphyrinogen III synthase n=1 Tax=Ascobolus immersus RN42 TaxID=1160509 RepID=A0A3N4IM09_ASCIM|nr:tetrapyrrole biosynthesis, uroporphyrinogen III synthase [Ascobolus immersus RN42]
MSETSLPVPLVLLKTKSVPKDPYEEYFSELPGYDFTPIFVPVMNHEMVNLDQVEALIRGGNVRSLHGNEIAEAKDEPNHYGGIIITSQRAVEALGAVLARLRADCDVQTFLDTTIVYVVGPATGKAVTELGFRPANVLGSDCGSGAFLAPFILETLEVSRASGRRRRLLFLTGETRSDVIPSVLDGGDLKEIDRVELHEIVVYKTEKADAFDGEFRSIIEKLESDGHPRCWVVVFSAMACKEVIEQRRRLENGPMKVLLATIGPTTGDYVRRTFNMEPDVVAPKPSPTGLWEGIKKQST